MADLFWASVEARSVLELPRIRTLFLPSRSCVASLSCSLNFHARHGRVCISSNQTSIGCLLSKNTASISDTSSASTPESPPPPPQTEVSEFDVVSTSEYSDGSIVFRFGHMTEIEKSIVQLEGSKISSARATTNEAASESFLNEESKGIVSLEVTHEVQQGVEVFGDGVNKVAPESIWREDRDSVIAVNTLQLGQKDRSDPVVVLTVEPEEVVNGESIKKESRDHHVLGENEELHYSSEHTQFGLRRADSSGPETSPNDIHEMSPVLFTEPDLDGTVNAASFVEKVGDLEELLETKAPEQDDSAALTDPEKTIRLEEEPLEGTSDEDNEAENLERLWQENAPDACFMVAEDKETSSTRMEEKDISLSSSSADFDDTSSNYNPSQEQSKENNEVDLSYLPPVSVDNEPKVDALILNFINEDTEETASSPAFTLVESTSNDDKSESNGELSDPEGAVEDGGESSNINEISDISNDESESDRHNTSREEILMPEICLYSGAASLPHPSKALAGGEDAYFICGENWFGIADGASQWSMEGTNRGLYAHELMENCKSVIVSNSLTHPLDVLVRSVAETEPAGSSTILVAQFDGQALHVANIGDSGFIIIRNGTVIEKSSPMAHEFNFPVQIAQGIDPQELAECCRIELEEGDVIIVGTDGMFDNLYEKEIASIAHKSLQVGMSPQGIAEVIATRAQEVGRSPSAQSPLADAAHAAGYVGFTSGKLDDVTVIISLVRKSSSSPTLK
ncbi:hypothetical protein SAY87_027476 [Trapa incisa]|uniref:Protein phosphatase n=1 Tax=Trapa incisa TaxID=236973 RepID=A0AAN7H4P1_9MYRT|nr:hypothetical protein SAY87_027476 [Trapa incisa]